MEWEDQAATGILVPCNGLRFRRNCPQCRIVGMPRNRMSMVGADMAALVYSLVPSVLDGARKEEGSHGRYLGDIL
jgi:hypothetical protein